MFVDQSNQDFNYKENELKKGLTTQLVNKKRHSHNMDHAALFKSFFDLFN